MLDKQRKNGAMKPINSLTILILFLALITYILTESAYRPYHNWDMIMYIAAAKSYEEQDVKSLHTFTYNVVRASVLESEYENLIQGEYRQAIYTDTSAFKEHLPFYQIRPLYTGTIYLLYKTGINIAFTTHIVSGISVAVALFLLYFLSTSLLGTPFAYSVPFLAIIFGVTDLAKYSTPDGMAFLAIILSAYLCLKQRILLLFIVLPIILGIRTDLILFTIPLLFFVFVFNKTLRKKATASMLISIILYITIVVYWNNPGWATIFYFTLIETQTHPLSISPTLTMHQYLSVLSNGTKGLLEDRIFLLYILISIYSLFLIINYNKTRIFFSIYGSLSALLSIVCIIFVFGHFLLFPVTWTRFFSGPYLIGAFAFLVMITNYLKMSNSAQ